MVVLHFRSGSRQPAGKPRCAPGEDGRFGMLRTGLHKKTGAPIQKGSNAMRHLVILFFVWMIGGATPSLLAQQRLEAVEVRVEDLRATPYGISITLRSPVSGEPLHMMIGVSEGESIARALSHRDPPRPMTHDLITTILGRTGWRVQRVLIRGLSGSTFLADLVLEKNGETEIIDSRPSDAMAIAVRNDAKIFVNPEVFELERQREQQELEPLPREDPSPAEGEGIHL